jgi:molybdopterin/thiamine biosynthesis adenylyltransferase
LGGNLGCFTLDTYDEFVNAYKATNNLAPEAIKAFDVFLDSLDNFIEQFDHLTENIVQEGTKVRWFSNAIIASSQLIRAKSLHYQRPMFSNVAIVMESESETNNSLNEICFGKVCIYVYFEYILIFLFNIVNLFRY